MHAKRKPGFTLVELTLVIVFMSVLMLAILYLSLYIGKIYAKGATNRTANQITRDIAATVRRDFQSANPAQIVAPAPTGNGDAKTGRICLGSVTYVWNTAPLINSNPSGGVQLSGKPVTFRRVVDLAADLCKGYPMAIDAALPAVQSSELLGEDGRSFAVYSLEFTPLTQDHKLYHMKITIGTNDPDTTQKNVSGTDFQCKPPSDNSANFNYCSVNDIDMILRIGGGKK